MPIFLRLHLSLLPLNIFRHMSFITFLRVAKINPGRFYPPFRAAPAEFNFVIYNAELIYNSRRINFSFLICPLPNTVVQIYLLRRGLQRRLRLSYLRANYLFCRLYYLYSNYNNSVRSGGTRS